MVFLGAFLAATAALLLAGTAPFGAAGVLAAWVAVGGVSWWYVRTTFSQVQTVAQPAGYGMAFGALLGSLAQIVAFGLRFAFRGTGALPWPPDAWALVAVATGVGIPAVLGGLGGLFGALQLPKTAHAARASLVTVAVAVAVTLLAGSGIVFYVLALAKAMSGRG